MVSTTTRITAKFTDDACHRFTDRCCHDGANILHVTGGLADVPSDLQLLAMASRLEKQVRQLGEKLDRLQSTLLKDGKSEEAPLSEPFLW